MSTRSFIEEFFPVREVSENSAKERLMRHGHISTLHIWWARRPLVSSRAVNYAALIPFVDEKQERNSIVQFIKEFSKWENSLNYAMIQNARKDILEANGGRPPRVLDPFAGGGSIPFEAMRLGCEVYAGDINPVAVLILKCLLEYPPKYLKHETLKNGPSANVRQLGIMQDSYTKSAQRKRDLISDVKKWSNWVLEEVKKEIEQFYPPDPDGSIPQNYLWAWTVPCQNLSCDAEIPLMRQYWLVRKSDRKIVLMPCVKDGRVRFKIVGTGYEEMPSDFDPSKGSVDRAIVVCPVCGSVIDARTVKRLFQEGKAKQKMTAVVLCKPGKKGKFYRTATEEDEKVLEEVKEYLEKKREALIVQWGMDPVPDEELPPKGTLGIRVQNYNINRWGDLFNPRQMLALVTFTEKIRLAYQFMLEEGYDSDYAKAIVSYLTLGLGRIADRDSILCVWHNTREIQAHTFANHALPMVWDYAEVNVTSGAQGWENQVSYILAVLENFPADCKPAEVTELSALSLSYSNEYFDAVFTDPPYYDNIPYSYLSDFFYIWFKRVLRDIYSNLFVTPLTPKKNEVVAYAKHGGKQAYKDMLKKSFEEIHRVLKPNGIVVIVYAHKSTDGWETLINSLLESGLVITSAWPIHTEMQTRIRAHGSAALASSIYIVARKMERQPVGIYNEVRRELEAYMGKKLERLWTEGIAGADFFIAAIGSAIEVFGKYEKVMDYGGNIIQADRMLEDIQRIAVDFAIRQILHNGFAREISPLTRFYILFRWSYQTSKVKFDEAQKLARICGLDLSKIWNKGFIRKDGEYIYLAGPDERDIDELKKDHSELIDALHLALYYWRKGENEKLIELLSKSGFGNKEVFYRTAQAIASSLPVDSEEKKLLEGLLLGKEGIINRVLQKREQMVQKAIKA